MNGALAAKAITCLRAIDVAWNARDWVGYAQLLDEDLIAYAGGEEGWHGKAEHIARAKAFCSTFPDSRVGSGDYISLFASSDGSRTCSVARITGTAARPLRMSDGSLMVPVQPKFDVTFAVVCQWRQGRLVLQQQYVDLELMLRQFRGDFTPSYRT